MGLPFIEGSKTVQSRAKKTLQKTLKRSAYLLWRGPTLDDFKMTFDFRIVGGNSRGHFRSPETASRRLPGGCPTCRLCGARSRSAIGDAQVALGLGLGR